MKKEDILVKIHGYVCSDGCIDFWKSKDMHGKKIRIRRKLRTRFYNADKEIIDDFINSIKFCFPNFKTIKVYPERYEIVVKNHPISKEILKLGRVKSLDWEFPKNISKTQKILWIRAYADCDGTVQNTNSDRFVAIDSINYKGLKRISRELKLLGIFNKIYFILGGKSFRLKVFKKENLIKYNKIVGFTHLGKQNKLNDAIKSYKYL